MRQSSLAPPILSLLVAAAVAACSGRRAETPRTQLSPRTLEAEPVVLPTPKPAPPPAPPPRPSLALVYTAGQRGRLTAVEVPTPPGTPPRNPGLPPITTGGLARRATVVDRARVEAKAVVQVDAGDFLPLPSDEPPDAVARDPKNAARGPALLLEGLHRLGVDAVTLGARELVGRDVRKLAAAFDKAHVPVVLANLVDAKNDSKKNSAVFPLDRVLDAAGTSVGVFGVAELGADDAAALKKAGFVLTAPEAATRARAESLRARGAKLVVALVNAAGGRARAAAIVAGQDIDVAVLAGAEGAAPPAPDAGAPTARPLIVVARDAFARVGRLDVRLAPGAAPAFDDRALVLETAVPEQLGTGLLSRAATMTTFDSEKLLAIQSRKKHVAPGALRDLYEAWSYASTNACGYCHEKQVAQWKTTDHAHAFATLTKASTKAKVKRDQDPECLGCHVIGFLQPGGSRDLVMARTQFADVGCEACHGPSAEHVRQTDKHRGTSRKVDPTVCLGCHTPDWSAGFDPVAAMKEILGPGHGAPASVPAPAPQPSGGR
jgi:Cytochrome c554 and c-prime